MKNPRTYCALLIAFATLNLFGQRANINPPMVNYELLKESVNPKWEQRDLALDNPLGVEIGMIQILDVQGKLMDAAIIRGDDSRLDLKGLYMPIGDYVLVFNTMLGFSFVQEITRAQF